MGDVACAWRVSYAPAGAARSAIWGLIFAWRPRVGRRAAAAWPLDFASGCTRPSRATTRSRASACSWRRDCGSWCLAARGSDDRRAPGCSSRRASCSPSTWCAVGACAQERSVAQPRREWDRLLCVGVPFALFAGWMLVATRARPRHRVPRARQSLPARLPLLQGDGHVHDAVGKEDPIWRAAGAGGRSWVPLAAQPCPWPRRRRAAARPGPPRCRCSGASTTCAATLRTGWRWACSPRVARRRWRWRWRTRGWAWCELFNNPVFQNAHALSLSQSCRAPRFLFLSLSLRCGRRAFSWWYVHRRLDLVHHRRDEHWEPKERQDE